MKIKKHTKYIGYRQQNVIDPFRQLQRSRTGYPYVKYIQINLIMNNYLLKTEIMCNYFWRTFSNTRVYFFNKRDLDQITSSTAYPLHKC